MNAATTDYQKVLTEVLQKQMVILGPKITLAKARHVEGLQVADDGRVTAITADGHAVSVKILEQFRELSPMLVKKTMRPLLSAILYQTPEPEQAPIHADAPKHEEHVEAKPAEEHHEEKQESAALGEPRNERGSENQGEVHEEKKE